MEDKVNPTVAGLQPPADLITGVGDALVFNNNNPAGGGYRAIWNGAIAVGDSSVPVTLMLDLGPTLDKQHRMLQMVGGAPRWIKIEP